MLLAAVCRGIAQDHIIIILTEREDQLVLNIPIIGLHKLPVLQRVVEMLELELLNYLKILFLHVYKKTRDLLVLLASSLEVCLEGWFSYS